MAKKPSFFERLTGTVNVDDYGVDESVEMESVSDNSMIDQGLENDWMEDEGNEGQLTVDVYQNTNEIVIKALVAGVRPEDLDVSITRDMVTIKGKREEAKQITEDNYFYKELYWGTFSRTILLPSEVEVEEAAEEGKRATIDFVGSIDGEEFEGGKAENFPLEMGAGRMIPGFEDGIVGKTAGMEFEIDVNFPEDYHAENLKGKAAKFSIKLNKVEARELPELNEEFVAKFGATDGVEGLKAEVRKNMERELKQAVKNRIKEQAIDGLVNENNIDVPSALIDQEIGVLRQQAAQRFGGNTEAADQLPRELFEEQAKRRVVVGLLLGEVIKSEELKADDEKVKAIIEEMATAYEDPSEVIAYYEQNEQMMNNMRNVALEEQAIDAIIAKAQVSEKEVSFNELMNQQPA